MATDTAQESILEQELDEFPLQLIVDQTGKLPGEVLLELSALNPHLQLEQNSQGAIVMMAPAGFESGRSESQVIFQLQSWANQYRTGTVLSSAAGFLLPNGAIRAPDASWISNQRLATVSSVDRQKFPAVVPEFIVEIRSPSDRLPHLLKKMHEYIENGVLLGWLIHPQKKQVHIYRPGQEPVLLDQPTSVSGDPELPGFVLDLTEIWPS